MQYSFAAPPRAVTTKANNLYRNDEGEKQLRNLMFDHPIVRGNTYSGVVVPSNNANAAGAGVSRKKRRGKRRVEPKSIFDIRPEIEKHERVDLTQFLVDQREETEVKEVLTQTDRFTDTPPPEPYVPLKTGIDAATQIEPEDNLFKFDEAVRPLLDVLVGKTVEQALQEVQEEEELRQLYQRKSELQATQEAEAQVIRGLEEKEVELWNVKEKKRMEELERESREADLEEKVWSAYTSRGIVAPAEVDNIFDKMQKEGHKAFLDPVQVDIEARFMPWVLDMMTANVEQVANSRNMVDLAIKRALNNRQEMEIAAAEERRKLEEAAAAPRKRMEEEERKGTIRIFVDGIEGVDQVGPIPVKANDTIEQVEAKIQEWIREKVGDSFTPPEGGVLKLAFEGAPLSSEGTLLDANVSDLSHVQVAAGEEDQDTQENNE